MVKRLWDAITLMVAKSKEKRFPRRVFVMALPDQISYVLLRYQGRGYALQHCETFQEYIIAEMTRGGEK